MGLIYGRKNLCISFFSEKRKFFVDCAFENIKIISGSKCYEGSGADVKSQPGCKLE